MQINNLIISQNLSIFHQLKEFDDKLKTSYRTCILLKGAGLIEIDPVYAKERVMDDIDILIKPGTLHDIKNILFSLGYSFFKNDPWCLKNPKYSFNIDICNGLWYLNKKENIALFDNAVNNQDYQFLKTLPAEDFYIHVLAHAFVHHGEVQDKWVRDLEVIKETYQSTLDFTKISSKMERYGLNNALCAFNNTENKSFSYLFYNWLFKSNIPEKGHLLKFVSLPALKKSGYMLGMLFPSSEFIRYRYELKNDYTVMLYRVLRPFLLLYKLASSIKIPTNKIPMTK